MAGSSNTQMWVDVYESARLGKSLTGQLDMAALARLADLREVPTPAQAAVLGDDARAAPIAWHAQFYRVTSSAAPPQSWLKLEFQTQILQKCVRCLEPVLVSLAQTRQFVFVSSEERALELDDELEDADVLVGAKQFDLRELIEDELIMSLPSLPEHESCDLPVQAAQRQLLAEKAARPFDMLKQLDLSTPSHKKH